VGAQIRKAYFSAGQVPRIPAEDEIKVPCLPAGREFLVGTQTKKRRLMTPLFDFYWCLYCTKFAPISKTNDVARAERVVV